MSGAKSRYGAADVAYAVAFQPETAPPRLQVALAIADTFWRPADRERLTVLDIGCGRGLTACLLAAANPDWDVIGLDLQPVHIAEAREVAAEAGIANARFIEADLAEFDAESAARLLPEVDVVICYGVWTWVPDAVREGILRLLKSRVKPGGVVYMGYNALPGFSDCIVLQRVLEEAARDVTGSAAERGAHALAALEALRAAGARYLPPAPLLDHIIAIARRNPAYMVHEWLTAFWRPVFHADLARDLARAGLDYGGSARPEQSVAEFNLDSTKRAAIAAAPPGFSAETLADTFVERRFRADIFVRGRRRGGHALLADLPLVMASDPAAANIQLRTRAANATLLPAQSAAIIDRLATGPATIGELAALPETRDLSSVELALLLVQSGFAHPLWRDPAAGAARARAARCNSVVLRRFGDESASINAPLGAVVPALGTGFAMAPSDLAVLVALQHGAAPDPAAIAARLVGVGDGPEAIAQAEAAVASLLARRLSAWRMMGAA
jgi:SAM-dependent methyltransferase